MKIDDAKSSSICVCYLLMNCNNQLIIDGLQEVLPVFPTMNSQSSLIDSHVIALGGGQHNRSWEPQDKTLGRKKLHGYDGMECTIWWTRTRDSTAELRLTKIPMRWSHLYLGYLLCFYFIWDILWRLMNGCGNMQINMAIWLVMAMIMGMDCLAQGLIVR